MSARPSDVRDACGWRGCREHSDIIYRGAGLCDEHWCLACSVAIPMHRFILPRVNTEAAGAIRQNLESQGIAT